MIIETALDNSGIERDLTKMGSLVKNGVGAAAKLSATAIAGVTAAIGAAGTAATAVGKQFETALAKASTMFGDVKVDTKGLETQVIALSNATGVAANQIGESLYNALSAGIPVTEDMGASMDYMARNAKLAKAGFTDVDTAVVATAKVLNAYKMDVSETDRVHKVLMQTQNKGITTVGELGSVLAQVTPTAAAMNVSFEQVGAALASMTAQGTPTAQATTMLNGLLAELGKEGTNANKALKQATKGTEYAGKSFDALMKSGVPLNKILDLMNKSAKDGGKSLLDMFGSLEAGKAALALAGQNSEQFTNNLKAMSTETDVVGNAYEKVMDTFEEKSKVAVENLKNLGISIYDNMKEPLKAAAETGIEYIGRLSNAFKSYGLEGLVSEAGNVFADVATKAAEQAPKMVDTAVDFIKAFTDGLKSNAPQLLKAGGKIVQALSDGFVQLLPSEIQKPIKSMVSEISKSLQGGGLKRVISTLGETIKSLGDIILNVAKVALPILTKSVEFLGKHSKVVTISIMSLVAAIKTMRVALNAASWINKAASTITSTTSAIGSLGKALGSLSKYAGAIGILGSVLIGVALAIKTIKDSADQADLEKRFGSISLSIEQIDKIAGQIANSPSVEKAKQALDQMADTNSKFEELQDTLEGISSTAYSVKLGMSLDENDIEKLKENVDGFISQGQEILKDQRITVSIVMEGINDNLKKQVDSTFAGLQTIFDEKGEQLRKILNEAIADGKLSDAEMQTILNLTKEMSEILEKVSSAEYKASLRNIQVDGNLTPDSYRDLLSKIKEATDSSVKNLEDVRIKRDAAIELSYSMGDMTEQDYRKALDDSAELLTQQRYNLYLQGVEFKLDPALQAFSDSLPAVQNQLGTQLENLWLGPGESLAEGAQRDIEAAFSGIQNEFITGFNNLNIPDETRRNASKIYEQLKPTQQQYQEISDYCNKMGLAVPINVQKGLSDIAKIGAIGNQLDAINYLMGAKFSNDPEYMAVLEKAQAAGIKIPTELMNGVNTAKQQAIDATGLMFDETGNQIDSSGKVVAQKSSQAGEDTVNAYTSSLSGKSTELSDAADETIKTAMGPFQLTDFNGIGTTAGGAVVSGMGDGMRQQVGTVQDASGEVTGAVDSTLRNADLSGMGSGYGAQASTGLASGITSGQRDVHTATATITSGLSSAFDNQSLPSKTWGSDLISGLAQGIRGAKNLVSSAVSTVANIISSWLHFSRPEKGPLHYYEQWMPDFMRGLARGIMDSKGLVVDEVADLASELQDSMADMDSRISVGIDTSGIPADVLAQVRALGEQGAAELTARARAAVRLEMGRISAVAETYMTQRVNSYVDTQTLADAVRRACREGCAEANIFFDGSIETQLVVDGRRLASATAPYTDTLLGEAAGRKKRYG